MSITEVLAQIQHRAGLASSIELHIDRMGRRSYVAYIDHPRYTRTAATEKEAVARSIEAWLQERGQDRDEAVESLRVLADHLRRNEGHTHFRLRKIEQEAAENDLRRGG